MFFFDKFHLDLKNSCVFPPSLKISPFVWGRALLRTRVDCVPLRSLNHLGDHFIYSSSSSSNNSNSNNSNSNTLSRRTTRRMSSSSASAKQTPVYHWFRNDLRLDDNTALAAAAAAAAKQNRPLVPCYIFDPRVHCNARLPKGDLKTAGFRTKFLLESVADLRKQLNAEGYGLLVAVGKPEDIFASLLPKSGEVGDVFCQTEVSVVYFSFSSFLPFLPFPSSRSQNTIPSPRYTNASRWLFLLLSFATVPSSPTSRLTPHIQHMYRC